MLYFFANDSVKLLNIPGEGFGLCRSCGSGQPVKVILKRFRFLLHLFNLAQERLLLVVLGENALYHLVRFFRGPFVNDGFRSFFTRCFRRSACYHPAAAPSEYYFGILAAVFSDYLFRAAVRQEHPAIQQLVRIHYRYLFAVPAQSAAVFHIVKLREVQRNVTSAYRVSPDGR